MNKSIRVTGVTIAIVCTLVLLIYAWTIPAFKVHSPGLTIVLLFLITFYYWGFLSSTENYLLWFSPVHVTRSAHDWKMTFLASGVLACLILALSETIHVISTTWTGQGELGSGFEISRDLGLVFYICGLLITVMGVLNTVILLNERLQSFSSFKQLSSLIEVVSFDLTEDSRSGRPGQEKAIYLLDYSPSIGEISDPASAISISDTLQRMGTIDNTTCHFVFSSDSPPDDLVGFYSRSSEQTTEGLTPERRAQDARNLMGKLDTGRIAVWWSDRIHSEHYFVSPNKALVYFVVPEKNGNRNDLKGHHTADPAQVEYLRDVVIDYIRDAITPRVERNGAVVHLYFPVNQIHIGSVEFWASSDRNQLLIHSIESTSSATTCGKVEVSKLEAAIPVQLNDIKEDASYIRVRLQKTLEPDRKPRISPFSDIVKIQKEKAST